MLPVCSGVGPWGSRLAGTLAWSLGVPAQGYRLLVFACDPQASRSTGVSPLVPSWWGAAASPLTGCRSYSPQNTPPYNPGFHLWEFAPRPLVWGGRSVCLSRIFVAGVIVITRGATSCFVTFCNRRLGKCIRFIQRILQLLKRTRWKLCRDLISNRVTGIRAPFPLSPVTCRTRRESLRCASDARALASEPSTTIVNM